MKTEHGQPVKTTCPLMRLFAPVFRRDAPREPLWEELELQTRSEDSRIELRLLRDGVESGRVVAHRDAQGSLVHRVPASGPRWCRDLLEEAVREWARQEGARP